jgi:hypothetical protein
MHVILNVEFASNLTKNRKCYDMAGIKLGDKVERKKQYEDIPNRVENISEQSNKSDQEKISYNVRTTSCNKPDVRMGIGE